MANWLFLNQGKRLDRKTSRGYIMKRGCRFFLPQLSIRLLTMWSHRETKASLVPYSIVLRNDACAHPYAIFPNGMQFTPNPNHYDGHHKDTCLVVHGTASRTIASKTGANESHVQFSLAI